MPLRNTVIYRFLLALKNKIGKLRSAISLWLEAEKFPGTNIRKIANNNDADETNKRWAAPIFPELETESGIMNRFNEYLGQVNFMICISNSDYMTAVGGSEKLILEEEKQFLDSGVSYVHLYPHKHSFQPIGATKFNKFVGVNIDNKKFGVLDIIYVIGILNLVVRKSSNGLLGIHIHHLMGWSMITVNTILETIKAFNVRFFVHDYYSVCHQYNLLRHDLSYCGGGHIDECGHCSDCEHFGGRLNHFRTFDDFFKNIHCEIVAPSATAAKVWGDSYSNFRSRIRVIPHQVLIDSGHDQMKRLKQLSDSNYKAKIAYVGYPAVHKGSHLWEKIVDDRVLCRSYNLYVFGLSHPKRRHVTVVPVNFHDDGIEGMEDALLKHGIDAVFLWSICAETYSYTLHESMAANCMILTNSISGNIAAVVKKTNRGVIFESDAQLLSYLRDPITVKSDIFKLVSTHKAGALRPNPTLVRETLAMRQAVRH